MSFRILSVCTGNVCRSPIAELFLARELAGFPDVRVASAGVGALAGQGVPEPAQRLARSHQIDASTHVARQIDESTIRESDLVLAMARDHRRAIVQMVPAATRRIFTLRELARITEVAEPSLAQAVGDAETVEEALRSAVRLAATLRGTLPPPADQDEFDVVDPYRRSDDIYEASFDALVPAAERVARYLTTAASMLR